MSDPWYKGGLRFECTGCGNCCTGAPGYVWVNSREIEALAGHLAMSVEEFGRRYLRRVRDRYSLLERSNGDCIFFREGKGCTVYQARPRQCRTFPFWPEHLRSPSTWEELKASCPGAGLGRLHPPEEIQIIKKGQRDA
jgi:Fe-S-cluster containining protein